MRWEAGRLAVARMWVPRLLGEGIRRRSLAILDAAWELVMPPLSLLGLTALAVVATGALLGNWTLAAVGAVAVGALTIHVIGGLLVARVPLRTWAALLPAPFYALWKLGLYLRVLAWSGPRGWVRTVRPRADN